jgi:hypothetical protein
MSLIPFAPFTLANNLEAERLQRAKNAFGASTGNFILL